MYRTALRNLLAHKGRLAMTALAVLLGTAFVAGIMVFSDTVGRAAKNSYSKSYAGISVVVTDEAASPNAPRKAAAGSPELTDATVRRIAALPGTAHVRGMVADFLGVADQHGDLVGPTGSARGANFVPDASGDDPWYPMSAGRGPRRDGEIALDQGTAKRAGYHVGDTVRIAANGPTVKATLTGIFTTDDPVVSAGGTLTLLDTRTAQQMLLTPCQYRGIAVTAGSGTAPNSLLERIEPLLPGGANSARFDSKTARELNAEQVEMVEQHVHSLEFVLLVFGAISLFVGVFIIANTFTMLIAQRTGELALLRALGASRRQIATTVLAEALVVGTAASMTGLAAGIGIGTGLRGALASGNPNLPSGPLVVAPGTVVTVVMVGVLVTALSAALPAVRASRIPPVTAMSSNHQPAPHRTLLLRNCLGALIAVSGLGLVLLGASVRGGPGRSEMALGGALAAVGTVVLLPMLSRPMIAMTGPALARLYGTPGRLARLNAVRNPRRTAATAAAISISLTLVTGLSVLGASVTSAMDRTIDASMKADYSVAPANNRGLARQFVDQIAKAPGVAAAGPITNVRWTVDGRTKTVEGVDAETVGELIAPTMTAGSTARLGKGDALVSSTLAQADGLTVHSSLKVRYADGSAGFLTVGGIFADNQLLAPIVMSNALITAHEPHPYITEILVKGEDGATTALRRSIDAALGGNPIIEVRNRKDMRDEVSHPVTTALSLMQVFLGVSVLVAVVGVINTMVMSVFERRREFGLLRAIGMDARGVKRTVRIESVLISLLGAFTGTALGSYLAWAGVGTLDLVLPNITTVVPYGRLLLFLLLAALVGVTAAHWPAHRASRLNILDSIKAD